MDIALFQSLTRAGVPDEQARAAADGIRAEINRQVVHHTAHLATREDLVALQVATREDLGQLRTDVASLQTDVAGLRKEMAFNTTTLRHEFKADMAELRQDLKVDMAELRSELKTDIQSIRTEVADRMVSLHRWTLGTSLTVTSLVVAALRAWPTS